MLPIVFIDMKENGERVRPTTVKGPVDGARDDPFFKAVRDQLAVMKLVNAQLNHEDGKFPSQRGNNIQNELASEEETLAAVYGILERDNMTKPEVDRFGEAVVTALSEYSSADNIRQLFHKVLGVLANAGETPTERHVRANLWVAIVRAIKGNVAHTDPHLDEIVTGVLVDLRNADNDGSSTPSAIDIDLPTLEDDAEVEIIPENLHATQAIYFAAILEEHNWFRCREIIVEQTIGGGFMPFKRGGRGTACDIIYNIWKNSNQRLSEMERRNLYARIFGFPGGEATPQSPPNRVFNESWMRFASSVADYVRQRQYDKIFRSSIPFSGNQEQVRSNGRSLAGNLSLYGYGRHIFAIELQKDIREMLTLFNDPEIKEAYGAHDAFQVIEQISALDLGDAKSSTRCKILANSGAIIIRWLANNRSRLVSSSLVPVLDDKEIRGRVTALSRGKKSTIDPTDYDLVNACEQWLAVTGTPDARVEEYAQPYEPPMMTSRPIQIPSIAKDMLESVGVQAGMDSGNGRYSRYARR